MKTLPLELAMRTCAEIGYSHIEFALNAGYPTEPAVFTSESRVKAATMLRQLRLSLPCLMLHMSLTADDKAHVSALDLIQSASGMGRDLVPEQPPILETVLGGTPTKWEEQKKSMADRLHAPERLLWLLNEVKSPSIQIAYDYSHFELQGIDMEESMKLLLPHTRFIHVKDSVGELGKFQFVLPGSGRTDYVKYFGLLRQHSYAGPVCVEVSGQVFNKPDYNPIAAAKECYRVLSDAKKNAS